MHAAWALGTHIYVSGGRNVEVGAPAEFYRCDTEADAWANLKPMPEPRQGHASVVLIFMIYVLGGEGQETTHSSVVRFDPPSGSWSRMAPMFLARADVKAFVLGGHIYCTQRGVKRRNARP